jgi:hypothetical protein
MMSNFRRESYLTSDGTLRASCFQLDRRRSALKGAEDSVDRHSELMAIKNDVSEANVAGEMIFNFSNTVCSRVVLTAIEMKLEIKKIEPDPHCGLS